MRYSSTVFTPLLLPLAAGACGSSEPTSEFAPVYYAAVYGIVRQGGNPVTGIEVQSEVHTSACPPTSSPTSSNGTRSGVGGTYRLLLASSSPSAGQCLRISAAGMAAPVTQTLSETNFTAISTDAVQDSIQIDLVIP